MYAIDDTASRQIDEQPLLNHIHDKNDNTMLTAKPIVNVIAAILLAATAASYAREISQPYGKGVQTPHAQREITVDSKTKYINVDRGEVVRFVTPQSTFVWSFDTGRNRSEFEFARIVPHSVNANGIRVFVREPSGER